MPNISDTLSEAFGSDEDGQQHLDNRHSLEGSPVKETNETGFDDHRKTHCTNDSSSDYVGSDAGTRMEGQQHVRPFICSGSLAARIHAIVEREHITSTEALVNALNTSRETEKLRVLHEVACFYFSWFQAQRVDHLTAGQIKESMYFGKLHAGHQFNSDLLCQWCQTLCQGLHQAVSAEANIAEGLERALRSIDGPVLRNNPGMLTALLQELMAKVDQLTEFTREMYKKKMPTLVTLNRAIFMQDKFSKGSLDLVSEDGVYGRFTRLLQRIVGSPSTYYPFRYQCEMITQELSSLESGECGPSAVPRSVIRILQSISKLPLDVSDEDKQMALKKAGKALKDVFKNADMSETWQHPISALHWLVAKVFKKPELGKLMADALDGLYDNARCCQDKEARIAVRFGIIEQLRIFVQHGWNEDIQSTSLAKLLTLAEQSDKNGWGDDKEIFEALLDALCDIYSCDQHKIVVQNVLETVSTFQDPAMAEFYDSWCGGQPPKVRLESQQELETRECSVEPLFMLMQDEIVKAMASSEEIRL